MKHTYIITAILALLSFAACNDKIDLFPDEYQKVLAFKNAGTHNLSMNTTIDKLDFPLLVLRGGGSPDTESNLEIHIMDKAEACAAWNYNEDQIEIIPTESYRFPEGTAVHLDADESHKYISVELYPQIIYETKMNTAPDAMWILPIILTSRTDTINRNLNKVLIRCDVGVPEVIWDNFEGSSKDVEITYKEIRYPLTLKVANAEYNTTEIVASLDQSENEELVTEYNTANGKNYELLPESAYSFNDITIAPNQISGTKDLILKRDGIIADKTYILPLKFQISTNLVEKDETIKYLVITNPKYAYADIDKSNWRIAFTNQESANVWGAASNLIDGNPASLWISRYDTNYLASDDFDDYIYPDTQDYAFTSRPMHYYPSCWKTRPLSNAYIVIDMGESLTLGAVGFEKQDDIFYNRTLKNCKVDVADNFRLEPYSQGLGGSIADYSTVSNAPEGWTQIFDCYIENSEKGLSWTYMSPSITPKAGRYIRLNPYGSWHDSNPTYATAFGEFHAKKLIAIDGEPL